MFGKFFLEIEKQVKKNDPNREHVEYHFTKNPNISKCNIVAPKKYRYPNMFLEVDTYKDFQLVSAIFQYFNKKRNFLFKRYFEFYEKKSKTCKFK